MSRHGLRGKSKKSVASTGALAYGLGHNQGCNPSISFKKQPFFLGCYGDELLVLVDYYQGIVYARQRHSFWVYRADHLPK
jgi:hypothetical protein